MGSRTVSDLGIEPTRVPAVEPPEDRADEVIANHLAIVAALRTHEAGAARQAGRRRFTDVRAIIDRAEKLTHGG